MCRMAGCKFGNMFLRMIRIGELMIFKAVGLDWIQDFTATLYSLSMKITGQILISFVNRSHQLNNNFSRLNHEPTYTFKNVSMTTFLYQNRWMDNVSKQYAECNLVLIMAVMLL